MLKICLCSDNHGDLSSIEKIKTDNPMCDYYFHCGDSSCDEILLRPFVSVEGNNDWDADYPRMRKFEIGGHKILLLHGDGYTYALSGLVNKAKHEECDTVFFGHTHEFLDEEYKGVRLINPGSTCFNRDYSSPSYALITIAENGNIDVRRINLK